MLDLLRELHVFLWSLLGQVAFILTGGIRFALSPEDECGLNYKLIKAGRGHGCLFIAIGQAQSKVSAHR